MKVRIVCYEDLNTWILGKFALRLYDNLKAQGVEVDIKKEPDNSADINHHIIYGGYNGKKNTIDTVMITHIDEEWKYYALYRQLQNAEMGICMSRDTLRKLVKWGRGMPRAKLCYINPAQDSVLKPRKLVIGIMSKIQPTGCKREFIIAQLADRISPSDFRIQIMGPGWDTIVHLLRSRDIEVDYFDHFNYKAYCELMPQLDYFLYMGKDEGSMAFLDALAAGIPTIATPQGFHLDVPGGITHPFGELDELVAILSDLIKKRRLLADSVSKWTWPEYARKHLLLWDYLIQKRSGVPLSLEVAQQLKCLGVVYSKSLAFIETAFNQGASKVKRLPGTLFSQKK